jgi:hypothetical protein
MAEVITSRRQRRVITSSPQESAPSVTPAGGEALQQMLQQHRDIIRTRRYSLIGRLSRVQVVRPDGPKTIDFRKEGPVLAFATGTEQLVVTSQWAGIPAKWDDTEEFCPACLSACDVCQASGKKVCEGYKCGGSGKIPLPMVSCPAAGCLAKTGKVKPHCAKCGGTGMFVPKGDCQACAGTGVMTCSVCRGMKKRPTGIKDGSTNWRDAACVICKGSKFAHKEIPQPIEDFLDTRIGSMVALGPIVRFAVESVGGEGSPPQVYDVQPDTNGQHMVILLESEQPGAGVFMIGGVLNSVTRR